MALSAWFLVLSACVQESVSTPENKVIKTNANQITSPAPPIKKADFTMTAEEYVNIFTNEKTTIEDLKKYAAKNFAVKGHVKQFSLDTGGYAPPYIVLGAKDAERGVQCILSDADRRNLSEIRFGNLITVQGTSEENPMKGIPAALSECVVLKSE